MTNAIAYASIFQPELDQQLLVGATSGWMEPNSAMVKYNGGSEIRIPDILMDGLGDYDRAEGFTKGSVTLKWQTHTLTQDRSRTFNLDAMDVDESNFVVTAGVVMGEFQRTMVIPEVDAYRYSKIATLAVADNRASGDYTPDETTILNKLLTDIAKVQDQIGEGSPLVLTLPFFIATLLDTNTTIQKRLDVMEFEQGGIKTKVKALDGHPIIRVPAARLKTAYEFLDGETPGQEQGGFKAAANAKNINWIIAAQNAPIAVSKTDKPRIFDPETNQKADAWKIDYRKYHDLWIPSNKLAGVFVNIKEAL
ncbi:hypothetical protein P9B03_08580 [Metasolibacillus meyeri]|uniref:Prophage protein n=1 Tax=Metasolibacillus meyeri TaxID=1071052 RepID=A0AAW9NIP4_9BACL|nr:hypothetical protein [Metasolibacillus meyeri]MEC1178534.1 hypothetical protein [Metasolibacillus meyeri]